MSKSGFYIAVACAIPNVPIQVTISEGALDAHFAIAPGAVRNVGANCDSPDSQWRAPWALVLADMWRLRLPERLPTGTISGVNALDVPAERIIAEGRNHSRCPFAICDRVRFGFVGSSWHRGIQDTSGLCRHCDRIGGYTGLETSRRSRRGLWFTLSTSHFYYY